MAWKWSRLLAAILCCAFLVTGTIRPTLANEAGAPPGVVCDPNTGICCLAAQAAPMSNSINGQTAAANLDLSSTNRSVSVGGQFTATSIMVGGTATTVAPNSMVTPAEFMALHQVLTTGSQTLLVGAQGNATGGQVNLTAALNQAVSNLILPANVTAVHDFATAPVNILGNLTNSGSFYAVSTSTQTMTAAISAANIFNQQGALISSVLPSTSLLGLHNVVSNLNLSLNAVNNIVNQGTIASSGNLVATAGGSISNYGAVGGPTAIMQAMGSVTLNSTNIQNAGLISAITGNINIASQAVSDLLVNNTNGVLQALGGSINIGNALASNKQNAVLNGGDLISRELNVFANGGNADISVQKITGVVNITGHETHVTTAASGLTLGSINLTGDPTFYADGNLTLPASLNTGGDSLAAVASGDILAPSGASYITQGGDITMVAGADFSVFETSQTPPEQNPDGSFGPTEDVILSITGSSFTGGSIRLGNISALSSAGVDGDGGDITLVAFASASGTGGTITLPSTLTVTSGGSDNQATNGRVSLIAGSPFSGNAINIGSIDTTGGEGGGQISLEAARVGIDGEAVEIGTDARVNFGSFFGGTTALSSIAARNLTSNQSIFARAGGNVALENLNSSSSPVNTAGNITVEAGGDISTGTITTSGQPGINSGSLTLTAGRHVTTLGITTTAESGQEDAQLAGQIDITAGGFINTGSINANGARGGDVFLEAAQSITTGSISAVSADFPFNDFNLVILKVTGAGDIKTGAVNASNATPNAGTIRMDTASGNIEVTGAVTSEGGEGVVELKSAIGKVFVSDGISVRGPSGGSVQVISNSSSPFVVVPSGQGIAGKNGVSGAILANADMPGEDFGNGGSIEIRNSGTGGIVVSSPSLLNVQAQEYGFGASGGKIILIAGTGNGTPTSPLVGTGAVKIGQGTIDVAAAGEEAGDGGVFSVVGKSFAVTAANGGAPTASLLVKAAAVGPGDGPNINIFTATGDLTVGTQAGQVEFSTTENEGASGAARIAVGGNLTVNNGSLDMGPEAILDLRAGLSGTGKLLVIGTLTGSTIGLSSNSTTPFLTFSAAAGGNGTTGDLFANDISVVNLGTGGVTVLTYEGFSLEGTLTLGAPNGTLQVPQGELFFNANFTGKPIVVTAENGGAATAPLTFVSSAIVDSRGLVDVNIGDQAGDFQVGGDLFLFSVSAGRNLVVRPNALSAGSIFELRLAAGTSGSGRLFVADSVNSRIIKLISNSTLAFVLGGAPTNGNGVTGSISFVPLPPDFLLVPLPVGGGSLEVLNNGTGGVVLSDLDNVDGISNGDARHISLRAPNGALAIAQGTIQVSPDGPCCLASEGLFLEGNSLVVTANGGGSATATLLLLSTGPAIGVVSKGNVSIGELPGELSISAGGSAFGNVTVTAGGNLTVDFGALQVQGSGMVGGPRLTLAAGTAGSGNLKIFGGDLVVLSPTGAQAGLSGAVVNLISNSSSPFVVGSNGPNGTTDGIVLQDDPDGAHGNLFIENLGTGGVSLPDPSLISINGTKGGNLSIRAPQGNIVIAQGTLSVNASESQTGFFGQGGSIVLFSKNLIATGSDGPVDLSANGGQSSGLTGFHGGEVTIIVTEGGLQIGQGVGQFRISARPAEGSNDFVNAGSASISTNGALIVDAEAIDLSSGVFSDLHGGRLVLSSNTRLFIDGSLNVSGLGGGEGGKIILSSGHTSPFIIGNDAPVSGNGINGSLFANGGGSGNGGLIHVISLRGGFVINAAHEVHANGLNGGTIVFDAAGTHLNIENNGEVRAVGEEGPGLIALHSGPGKSVNMTGAGSFTSSNIRIGNLAPLTFALLAVPAGAVSIASTLTVVGTIATNGIISPPGGGPNTVPTPPTEPVDVPRPLVDTGTSLTNNVNNNLQTNTSSAITSLNTTANQTDPLGDLDPLNMSSSSALVSTLTVPTEPAMEADATNASNFTQNQLGPTIKSGAGTGNNFFNLDVGKVVFLPTNPITVGTHEGDVQIPAGSIVFVVETGNDVAVYDLHDTHPVKIVVGNKQLTLQPGTQVVLTRQANPEYDKVNPGPKISQRGTKLVEVGDGVKAFVSEFSIPSALIAVAPLKQMLKSGKMTDRKQAQRMLKNAVILSQLTPSSGPFRNP